MALATPSCAGMTVLTIVDLNRSRYHPPAGNPNKPAMKISCPILILFILSGCSSNPYVVDYTAEPLASGAEHIYVVSHGWHTVFVIPAAAIQSQLPKLRERFGDTPYIEFGWGEEDYYYGRVPLGHNLVDSWTQSGHGQHEGATWYDLEKQEKSPPLRLDYGFVSPDLADRVQTARIDEDAPGSDHQPYWFELEF